MKLSWNCKPTAWVLPIFFAQGTWMSLALTIINILSFIVLCFVIASDKRVYTLSMHNCPLHIRICAMNYSLNEPASNPIDQMSTRQKANPNNYAHNVPSKKCSIAFALLWFSLVYLRIPSFLRTQTVFHSISYIVSCSIGHTTI